MVSEAREDFRLGSKCLRPGYDRGPETPVRAPKLALNKLASRRPAGWEPASNM